MECSRYTDFVQASPVNLRSYLCEILEEMFVESLKHCPQNPRISLARFFAEPLQIFSLSLRQFH